MDVAAAASPETPLLHSLRAQTLLSRKGFTTSLGGTLPPLSPVSKHLSRCLLTHALQMQMFLLLSQGGIRADGWGEGAGVALCRSQVGCASTSHPDIPPPLHPDFLSMLRNRQALSECVHRVPGDSKVKMKALCPGLPYLPCHRQSVYGTPGGRPVYCSHHKQVCFPLVNLDLVGLFTACRHVLSCIVCLSGHCVISPPCS